MSDYNEQILDELRIIRQENRETRDMVIELKGQVSGLPDHETRIRALEKWRYSLPASVFLGVCAMGTSVFNVLTKASS